MTDQKEFQESDIWGGNTGPDPTPSESSEEVVSGIEDEDDEDDDDRGRKRGASSSSSSEEEYDMQMEQNIKAFRGAGTSTDSLPIDFNSGSFRGRPRVCRDSPDEAARFKAKLGTSMPINIPMMITRRQKPSEGTDQPDKAQTFVPPHLVAQPDARANFSLSSASAAKREKLLQRNAILRRTGFIEADTKTFKGGEGALPELMDPLNRRMLPIKESNLEPSALSAALGSPTGNGQQDA